MRRGQLIGLFYLNLATLFWGSTFVLVKDSLESLVPGQINFARFALASLFFLPFLWRQERALWRSGVELGALLFLAYLTQTVGLQYTTASRSAFITTLYVVMLPLFLGLLGHRLRWTVWMAAGLAVLGVGLLSYDGSPPNLGDLWTLGTALCFTFYIWRMERHARRFAALPLTGVQMLTVAGGSGLWMLFETPRWEADGFPYLAILYLGVVASALCIWLQVMGQRSVPAPQAAIVFTLEPVYAAAFAYFMLGERLGAQGLVGAALVVAATLVSQLQGGKPRPEQITPGVS
ncbi:EamA/RhaT family transporter [Meiothermus sp. QL-1]|uniref:DMT family transporter n=1 Tax=Meiothermus sp. QL-1 TaxID=2058095 RepID=UPI000E0A7BA8|nr:EamA family transporter [Meiothermus sp. QL-1]RDI95332.1 EamA/RhaT family transporter [Meiothermus sp. QL-1]